MIVTYENKKYELKTEARVSQIYYSSPEHLTLEAEAVGLDGKRYQVIWEFSRDEQHVELDDLDYSKVYEVKLIESDND